MTPETEGSSPCSQEPATGPFPEPFESTQHPSQSPEDHSDSIPQSSEWSLFFGLSYQNILHSFLLPMHVICPAPLIPLDLICLMTFVDEYTL
jgi:hypothetical protein